MKNKRFLLFITLFFLSSCSDSTVNTENIDGSIMKTLNNYFEGRRNADMSLLKEAFTLDANLETVNAAGAHQQISFDDYLQVVAEKGTVEVKTQVMYLSIIGNIAMAQTRFDYGDRVYLDYLTLLKTNQGWRITNKAFIKI